MAFIREILKVSLEKASERGDGKPSITSLKPQDTVTPQKICILIIIREYLESKDNELEMECEEKRDRSKDPTEDVQVMRENLKENKGVYSEKEKEQVMLLLVDLLNTHDVSLNELRLIISRRVVPYLTERFENTLIEIFNGGICQMSNFFDRLDQPPNAKYGEESSQYTKLNRFSVVGLFVRSMLMSFKLMSLEDIMTELVPEFINYCKESLVNESNRSLDISLASKSTRSIKSTKPSKWQAESRLTQLTVLLEENENEAGKPIEVADEVNALLRNYPSMYQAFYVHYLNCMRVKEYSGARDYLHQFYDQLSTSERVRSPEDINKNSRYASISLASLYARFGHIDQAMHSIKEAVKLAQEANDKTCLRCTLIWLQHLDQSDQAEDAHQLSALLNDGDEMPIPASFIRTLKAPDLANPPKEFFNGLSRVTMTQTKGSQAINHLMASSQKSLASALWSHFGYRSLAGLVSQSIFKCSSVPHEQVMEAESLALCTLSNQHFYLAEYESASTILNIVKDYFPRPFACSELWVMTELCQQFDRAYYHKDVESMALACDNILALDPLESRLRRASLYRCKNLYQQSRQILEDLSREKKLSYRTFKSIHLVIRIKLELIELFCSIGDYNTATVYIIDCIKLTTEFSLELEKAVCLMFTAYIQLMKGDSKAALHIITENMGTLLICGDRFTSARAQMLYTRCKIAAADNKEQRLQNIEECISMVEKAKNSFEACEAFVYLEEALVYLSLLYHTAGNTEQRNFHAFKYKEFQKDHASEQSSKSYSTLLV